MTFGRVGFWHDFPQVFIDTQRANPVKWPVVKLGTGFLLRLEDQEKFSFTESGFTPGILVAFDLADGPAAQYAVNLRKALRVPAFVHGRIVSWKVVEWNDALAASVEKALAGRAAEGYQPQRTLLPWRG